MSKEYDMAESYEKLQSIRGIVESCGDFYHKKALLRCLNAMESYGIGDKVIYSVKYRSVSEDEEGNDKYLFHNIHYITNSILDILLDHSSQTDIVSVEQIDGSVRLFL